MGNIRKSRQKAIERHRFSFQVQLASPLHFLSFFFFVSHPAQIRSEFKQLKTSDFTVNNTSVMAEPKTKYDRQLRYWSFTALSLPFSFHFPSPLLQLSSILPYLCKITALKLGNLGDTSLLIVHLSMESFSLEEKLQQFVNIVKRSSLSCCAEQMTYLKPNLNKKIAEINFWSKFVG